MSEEIPLQYVCEQLLKGLTFIGRFVLFPESGSFTVILVQIKLLI